MGAKSEPKPRPRQKPTQITAVLSEKKAVRTRRVAGQRVVKGPADFALDAQVGEMLKRRAIASMCATASKT